MLPFVVSSDAIDQPEVLRGCMARDGYLFMPGLLPTGVVHALYSSILGICQDKGWADTQGNAVGQARLEGSPEFWDVYDEVQSLEAFHAFAHRPEILNVIHALVQEQVLVHPRNIARISFPNAVFFTTPAHQDFVHIQATPETYTAWIPLSDCPLVLGGLAVLAGSHKLGLLPVHKADGAGGLGVDTDNLGLEWHTSDYHAGDVLIFHSMAVHKALPNLTVNQLRLSTDYRYQGVSLPIVADGLEPHYGRLGWDTIYRGWQRADLQYYWHAVPLKIVARDTSFHENAEMKAK
jgi:ectoine hydroxylase-related dioxygenase (phytanoyl-CoA dioxygenase family)